MGIFSILNEKNNKHAFIHELDKGKLYLILPYSNMHTYNWPSMITLEL